METVPAEGRSTSQGWGHQIVAQETYEGVSFTVRSTPPTRFGVLYYHSENPRQAWATIAQAIEDKHKKIDAAREMPHASDCASHCAEPCDCVIGRPDKDN